MGKHFLIAIILSLFHCVAWSADLVEVFRQAQCSDPTYQQAISQQLASKEGLPISIASLLPNINLAVNPSFTRTGYAGTFYESTTGTSQNVLSPRNNTLIANTISLTAQQTVFNFAQFSTVAGQYAVSKQADATINAALQDLMVRVAKAYFAVLQGEDDLRFSIATKAAFAEQLQQIREQYKVGLKTLTDVYTAQASYDSAVASYIQAKINLVNVRENLRVITGVYYPSLAKLSENFPLIKPQPANLETWVKVTARQNWTVNAARYNVEYFRQLVRIQVAGHLPTISAQVGMNRLYNNNINGYNTFNQRRGPGTQTSRSLSVNVNVPIFAGGGIVAQTNQANYNYLNARQGLDLAVRNALNQARQSYNNVISGISQIKADQQTIKSTISSLRGMEASFQIGTETLFDVLNQQQKVFQAQVKYATDRYNFVNNLFLLKQAAGTLSYIDVCAVNTWLIHNGPKPSNYYKKPAQAAKVTFANKKTIARTASLRRKRHKPLIKTEI